MDNYTCVFLFSGSQTILYYSYMFDVLTTKIYQPSMNNLLTFAFSGNCDPSENEGMTGNINVFTIDFILPGNKLFNFQKK